jgi:large subunit ribosomal protein L6
MSRIGKYPIPVPKGVEVTVSAEQVAVKGPLGTLTQRLSSDIKIERSGDDLLCLVNNDSIRANAMSGTIRALVANMVEGVSKGFERKLTLVGVG